MKSSTALFPHVQWSEKYENGNLRQSGIKMSNKQCSVSNICSVKIDKARGELELVSQTWVKPNLRLKTFSKWRVCISRLNRYL